MKDKLGQELECGDYILYARTLGRSADLGMGRILSFTEKTHPAQYGRWMWVDVDQFSHLSGRYLTEAVQKWVDENVKPGLEVREHNWGDRDRRFSYYDEKALLKNEYSTAKLRVKSIQGLEFADINGVHQHGWESSVKDTAKITNVNLNYPNRTLKINAIVPDIVVELLGD